MDTKSVEQDWLINQLTGNAFFEKGDWALAVRKEQSGWEAEVFNQETWEERFLGPFPTREEAMTGALRSLAS